MIRMALNVRQWDGREELFSPHPQCNPWRCIIKDFVPESKRDFEQQDFQPANIDEWIKLGIKHEEDLRNENYKQGQQQNFHL